MRDPKRIPRILSLVGEFWQQNPDLRLAQLIHIFVDAAHPDIFYLEDDYLESRLQEILTTEALNEARKDRGP